MGKLQSLDQVLELPTTSRESNEGCGATNKERP
jgi:hypothetical protein